MTMIKTAFQISNIAFFFWHTHAQREPIEVWSETFVSLYGSTKLRIWDTVAPLST